MFTSYNEKIEHILDLLINNGYIIYMFNKDNLLSFDNLLYSNSLKYYHDYNKQYIISLLNINIDINFKSYYNLLLKELEKKTQDKEIINILNNYGIYCLIFN